MHDDRIPNLAAEIGEGDVLRLKDLASRFNVQIGTCFRWITEGLPATKNGRVHLKAIKRGKTWITSEAAVKRFFAALPQSENIGRPTPQVTLDHRKPAGNDRDKNAKPAGLNGI